MKRFVIPILLLCIAATPAWAKILGDFNEDGQINIVDAIAFVRIIMDKDLPGDVGKEYAIDKVKTSTGSSRIEIGHFDSIERIRGYGANDLAFDLYASPLGESTLGVLRFYGPDQENYNTTYEWRLCGWFLRPWGSACLILPSDSIESNIMTWNNGDAVPLWDNANKRLKMYVEGDQTYNFIPIKERLHAIGISTNATADPASLSETVHKSDFDSLVARVNAIIAVLGTGGHGLTADSL